jgi:hypothetical protein
VTQPCRTFQVAYSNVPANGEIDVLDPAGYGPLTITHGISIQAHGFGGISQPGTGTSAAITISVTTGEPVTLNGLLLDGSGTGTYGINITSGPSVQILDCVIRHFVYGIAQIAPGGLLVSNTRIFNSQSGIWVGPAGNGVSKVVMSRIEANENATGVVIDANGLSGGYVDAVLADSVVSSNSTSGVAVLNGNGVSLARLTTVSSKLMFNGNFGLQTNSSGVEVYLTRSTIFANGVPDIKIFGGHVNSAGDNMIGTFDPLTSTFPYH